MLAKDMNSRYWMAVSEYYWGLFALESYQYDEAIKRLNNAQRIVETLRETDAVCLLLCGIYLTKSGCYIDCNMLPEAYQCNESGLAIAEKNNLEDGRILLLGNKGLILYKMRRYYEAINIYKEFGKYKKDGILLENLADVYFNIGKYDTCLMYCDTLSTLDERLSNIIWANHFKGACYLKMKQYDNAILCFNDAINQAKTYNDLHDLSITYYDLSSYYYEIGNFTMALKYVDSANIVAKMVSNYERLRWGFMLKANIFNNMKNAEGEAEALRHFLSISDSLEMVRDVDKVGEMKMKHDVRLMEQQLVIEKKLVVQRHNFILIIAIIILVFLIVVVYIIWHNKKHNEKTLKETVDLRNREMTAKTMNQMQSNEVLNSAITNLVNFDNNQKSGSKMSSVIRDLKSIVEDGTKKDFDYYFVQVHPDFYSNLKKEFPKLTKNELRLCAYLKMNLSTKDITAISNITPDSVRVARTRLRKSLNLLGSDVDLVLFLSKY